VNIKEEDKSARKEAKPPAPISMSGRIRSLFQGFRSVDVKEKHSSPPATGFSSGNGSKHDSSVIRQLPPTPPEENDHSQLKAFDLQPQHINQKNIPIRSFSSTERNESNTKMSDAREIEVNGLHYTLSNALSLSASPNSTFHSPSGSYMSRMTSRPSAKQLKPFNTQDIKILLLENVNVAAREILESQGYQVEFHKASLPEDELIEKIRLVIVLSPHLINFFSALSLDSVMTLVTFCVTPQPLSITGKT
jgi:hypothetical protein